MNNPASHGQTVHRPRLAVGTDRARGRLRRARWGATAVGGIAMVSVLALTAAPARAEIVAAYVQGQGGVSSPRTGTDPGGSGASTPGVGVQGGVRLLMFEGYGDYMSFGGGVTTTRAIFGLRGALGLGSFRLIVRGGGGILKEEGGAVTGQALGVPAREGFVARAGVQLETKFAPTLLGGFGLDAETFSLAETGADVAATLSERKTGSDIFGSVYLKFELGI